MAKLSPLSLARQVKHRAWLSAIALRSAPKRTVSRVLDPAYARLYSGRRYDYRPGNFRRTFLAWDAEGPVAERDLPRRVFCFWTGDNEITTARRRNFDRLAATCGVPVTLVDPSNLASFLVADSPLHPAYAHLSLVHRSDYLRAYFMHHHGGGYSDIKAPAGSWLPVFEQMATDPDAWITGYPEHSSVWVAQLPGSLGRTLKRWHATLPGGGSFVARPGTPLTAEWLAEVERRLDYYFELVAANPGGERGEAAEYPISWNRLLAQVLHPLSLKHHRHVRVDPRLKPELTDYR